MKFEINNELIVEASAEDVWHIVAHRFDEIGVWATAIPASSANADTPRLEDAPMGGRVCETTLAGVPDVFETFTYYDEANMKYGYEATDGLPFFVKTAENNWHVQPIGPNKTIIKTWAVLTFNTFLGLLFGPFFKWQINRIGGQTMAELKYYIEQGVPHPRKVKAMGRTAEFA